MFAGEHTFLRGRCAAGRASAALPVLTSPGGIAGGRLGQGRGRSGDVGSPWVRAQPASVTANSPVSCRKNLELPDGSSDAHGVRECASASRLPRARQVALPDPQPTCQPTCHYPPPWAGGARGRGCLVLLDLHAVVSCSSSRLSARSLMVQHVFPSTHNEASTVRGNHKDLPGSYRSAPPGAECHAHAALGVAIRLHTG